MSIGKVATPGIVFMLLLAPLFTAAQTMPAPHSWLAKSPYAISHHNAAQTDATMVDGREKSDLVVPR